MIPILHCWRRHIWESHTPNCYICYLKLIMCTSLQLLKLAGSMCNANMMAKFTMRFDIKMCICTSTSCQLQLKIFNAAQMHMHVQHFQIKRDLQLSMSMVTNRVSAGWANTTCGTEMHNTSIHLFVEKKRYLHIYAHAFDTWTHKYLTSTKTMHNNKNPTKQNQCIYFLTL